MTVKNLHKDTAERVRRIFKDEAPPCVHLDSDSGKDFLEDIINQGMAPILWHQLGGRKGTADWPADIQSRLRTVALRETAVDLRLQLEVSKLVDTFAAAGLQPLLIKGTPLSYTLYPAPGLRPRCDTDILIAEKDRKQTADIMRELGYVALHEADVDFINSQMCYTGPKASLQHSSFDIHWMISNNDRAFSRRFSYSQLVEKAVNVPALGNNAWTLCPVDALIVACFHRAGHYAHDGDRLIWLYDIHLLSEALSAEEASDLCRKARKLSVVSLCVDAMVTAQSWFGSMLASPLELLLQEDPGVEYSTFLLQPGRVGSIRNKAVQDLKSMDTWPQRLRYLFQNVFPPPSYMLWRYNRKKKIALPRLYLQRLVDSARIFLRKE